MFNYVRMRTDQHMVLILLTRGDTDRESNHGSVSESSKISTSSHGLCHSAIWTGRNRIFFKKKKQMPIPTWRTGETGYPFPFLDQSEGRLEKRIAPARRTPQNYKIKIPFHGSKPKPKRKKIEEKIFQRTANKTTESKRNFLVREGESMAEPHKDRSFLLRSNPRSNP
jgi:hypothetical protein